MARILTPVEIERLSTNNKVDRVVNNRVYLTLEYRVEVYNEWLLDKTADNLKKILLKDGVYFKSEFAYFYNALNQNFKRYGMPKNNSSTIQGVVQDDINYLLSTNLFYIKGKGITVTNEFFNECKTLIQKNTLKEILIKRGIDLSKISYQRLYTLNNRLLNKQMNSRNLDLSNLKDRYSNNPYIKFKNKSIKLDKSFYNKAKYFYHSSIDETLKIFNIESKDFSYSTIYRIKNNIVKYNSDTTDDIHSIEVLTNMEKALRKELSYIKLNTKYSKHIFYKFAQSKINDKFNVLCFCKLFNISKSNFYKCINNTNFEEKVISNEGNLNDLKILKTIIDKYPYPLGTRMVKMLLPRGYNMSRRKITKILKENNLLLPPNKCKKNKFIIENLKPNLLKRQFRLARPLRILVTDVTYLPYATKRIYLSAIKDAVTGKILSFHLSYYNDINLIINTINKLDIYNFDNDIIFHSDQGIVYFAYEVQDLICKFNFKQSMSKRGCCWDNASMESFFSRYKNDFNYLDYTNINILEVMTNEYILYYNNVRPQETRNKMSPNAYECYLNNLSDDEFQQYLLKEKEKYDKMKLNSKLKVEERIKSMR